MPMKECSSWDITPLNQTCQLGFPLSGKDKRRANWVIQYTYMKEFKFNQRSIMSDAVIAAGPAVGCNVTRYRDCVAHITVG